ncbi:hypothetical protein Y1Q_0015669 [Alligator mississippiensis]|uniref:Uncharacterized protein n=1 Tax=Alligator mississippiensis TaxID=8496 RepID=A0A151NPL4_ALLMI|nr:hypothetical protein Y1Q_0015669 [Alligator mississippiensis]
MSNNPVTGKRSPSVSQNVHSEERASENLFCIYCSRSNGILGYAIIHLFQKEIYCTVLVSWSLAPVIMLAEGILTGIIYREKKQNKPHRCDINKKEKKETWKDHLVDRLATEDLATESKKQDKIIAKDSKKEHNKVLLPCKSTEELPAKEHNSAHVNGTMFTGLHIPEREHNNEKQLDLYRSWSCHSIYQNYPDLHIAGDHVGDYMLDSGCVMDDTCDELPDGPVLVSVDIPLGHSPPKEPLEKPTSKFLNGDEGIGKFFVVAIGGVLVGLIFGMTAAFTTRFTKNIRVIEPLFVFLYSYLSYLTAEMFHLSGIVAKKLFIAATTVIILFTVFVQGMTIRPLVELLDVKRKRESAPTVGEQIHMRFLDHLLAGIEDICGHWGQYYWKDKFEYFNSKYLQKFLLREYSQPKSSIVLLYEKLERKHAIELVEAGQLIHTPSHASLVDSRKSAGMVKIVDSLNSDVLENIQKILARNLYKIRRTVPAYNRHTLPGETGTEEQAKEILILRHRSLRLQMNKSDLAHSGKEGGFHKRQNLWYTSCYKHRWIVKPPHPPVPSKGQNHFRELVISVRILSFLKLATVLESPEEMKK